jgi:hypothetical protein
MKAAGFHPAALNLCNPFHQLRQQKWVTLSLAAVIFPFLSIPPGWTDPRNISLKWKNLRFEFPFARLHGIKAVILKESIPAADSMLLRFGGSIKDWFVFWKARMKKITRRSFIEAVPATGTFLLMSRKDSVQPFSGDPVTIESDWNNSPREFSQAPFWFWNDELSEKEILRQMKDFCDHGIYGFVIHPRAGLPRDTGWMSDRMIHFMRYAIEQAQKLDMWVVLYDEGMYPSGSGSGQVVAENEAFRPRGLFAIDLNEVNPGEENSGFRIDENRQPALVENQKLVGIFNRESDGHRIAVLDRFIKDGFSVIRGLHYIEENPSRRPDKKEVPEETPPLADILNPEAVRAFIRLVYQRFYDEFSDYFGTVIKAFFTDEPSFLGRNSEPGAQPGNSDVLEHVNNWLGYDFRPHLPRLFYSDEPDSEKYRNEYNRALEARLEKTYYEPISRWCREHKIALTGHPADPDDIGHLRYFQIPGQDIVWRYIEPGKPGSLEGPQSTQAKCASSAMIHLGRRRNSNEYCGAYGHDFTFREMKWLANWLLVRGCNLLFPHAFYYSVRGPRIDERPPDVGPNNVWWDQLKPFADSTSRLCWLNTDSKHICEVAILGLNDYLPWQSARVCFQNQVDFNYLEARHLIEDAVIEKGGIHIAGMTYQVLIAEIDPPAATRKKIAELERAGRLIRWKANMGEGRLLKELAKVIQKDLSISPSDKNLRYRHVYKQGAHFYILFNEGEEAIETDIGFSFKGERSILDTESGEIRFSGNSMMRMEPHEVSVVMIKPALI